MERPIPLQPGMARPRLQYRVRSLQPRPNRLRIHRTVPNSGAYLHLRRAGRGLPLWYSSDNSDPRDRGFSTGMATAPASLLFNFRFAAAGHDQFRNRAPQPDGRHFYGSADRSFSGRADSPAYWPV